MYATFGEFLTFITELNPICSSSFEYSYSFLAANFRLISDDIMYDKPSTKQLGDKLVDWPVLLAVILSFICLR